MNRERQDDILNYSFEDFENISFSDIEKMKKIRRALKYSYCYPIDFKGQGEELIYFSSQPGSTIEDCLSDRVTKKDDGYLSFVKKISYGIEYDISEIHNIDKGKTGGGINVNGYGIGGGINVDHQRLNNQIRHNKVTSNCDIYIYKIGGLKKSSRVEGTVELVCLGVNWEQMIRRNKKKRAKTITEDRALDGYENVKIPSWLAGMLKLMGVSKANEDKDKDNDNDNYKDKDNDNREDKTISDEQ